MRTPHSVCSKSLLIGLVLLAGQTVVQGDWINNATPPPTPQHGVKQATPPPAVVASTPTPVTVSDVLQTLQPVLPVLPVAVQADVNAATSVLDKVVMGEGSEKSSVVSGQATCSPCTCQSRVSLFAGPSFMNVTHGSDTGVLLGMNVRLYPPPPSPSPLEGEGVRERGRFGIWFLEVAGTLPQMVNYGFSQQVGYISGPTLYDTNAHVTSFSEVEFLVKGEWPIDPVGKYVAPEFGVGASRAKMHDTYIENPFGDPTPVVTADQDVTTWSPLVLFGLHFFPKSPNVSLRVDVGYVRWANNFNAAPTPYNLSLSTLFIRPALQVRF